MNNIHVKVNGKAHEFQGDPEMPLLWYLRDDLQLTGTKFGCGVGLCGSCTVHVGGEATRSCSMPMKDLAGKDITTIEGLSADGSHPVQAAWKANNVPQCGYCQSGQIMQAVALLKQTPKPTDEQIEAGMQGNICRCGTYQRIRKAIKQAAGVTA
jgi:isoquinoline 1-oxidoreductase alpha subunit